MRFVADIMLGKLVKWLRVLGFDTDCQTFKPIEPIIQMVCGGRIALTRQKKLMSLLKGSVFIYHDHVGDQLMQLEHLISIGAFQSHWFSRCIRCNMLLVKIPEKAARDNVPEYVFYHHGREIHFCPGCRRYFWPGSHRIRMERQLSDWGFLNPVLDLDTRK